MHSDIEEAIGFAALKHKGQLDKSGLPYIYHCLEVARRFQTEPFIYTCAILHDTVEDTDTSLDEIKSIFGADVAYIVGLLTHDKKDKYEDYINNLTESDIAIRIKISDLEHNLQLNRLTWTLVSKDFGKMEKYVRAHVYLSSIAL